MKKHTHTHKTTPITWNEKALKSSVVVVVVVVVVVLLKN
jgi:hypothetical protein